MEASLLVLSNHRKSLRMACCMMIAFLFVLLVKFQRHKTWYKWLLSFATSAMYV